MSSMIRTKLMVSALCVTALAGCKVAEDVKDEPFTPRPTSTVVLQGKVTGPLGNLRAVTLLNNGDNDRAIGVTASLGTDYTVFTFGAVPVGSTYNITVKNNPFGKICTVTGGTGTITTAEALEDKIVVNCVNDPNVLRYKLRVAIPPTFGSLDGAKVTLTTEEGVYSVSPAPGATSVVFNNVLFNNVVNGVVWGANSAGATAATSTPNGGINPYTNIVGGVVNGATFAWRVTATNTVGSTPDKPQVNSCAVTAGTNFNGATGGTNGAPGTPNYNNVAMPPVGDIGFGTVQSQIPTVGNCTFTIGGNVSYSYPAGTTPPSAVQPLPAGGLELQLKDVQGNVLETLPFSGSYASTTASTAAGSGYTFVTPRPSSVGSVYDVAVSRHPTGHYCVVTNGGQATLGLATAPITNANVVCRAVPTGAANNARLKGTYLFLNGATYNFANPSSSVVVNTLVTAPDGTLTTTTVTTTTLNVQTTYNSDFSAAIPGATPTPSGESWGQAVVSNLVTRTVVLTKPPTGVQTTTSDTTALSTTATTNQNITRNFLTFFEDGTFLHGVHGVATTNTANQIEHGFYLYDSTAGTIRFTVISDTNTSASSVAFVANPNNQPAVNNATGLVNAGLTGTGGQAAVNGSQTATMTNVVRGTLNGRPTLTGRFQNTTTATVGGVSITPGYGTTTPTSRWSTWTLIEPRNTDGLMEGAFATRDHRRVWVYDDNPKLGFHVGVSGGAANLQDSCYTVENAIAPSGTYTRRGGVSGCLGGLIGGISAVDIPQGRTAQSLIPIGTPVALESLPGFVGRIPAGQIAVDGRPPSPAYYVIARADQFATVASADPLVAPFFPAGDITPAALSWCLNTAGTGPGEVYGVRTSLNGAPSNTAVYFCRGRAN